MLYVVALALAPLSLVQAASAGGIVVLAVGGGRLTQAERVGVGAALAGLLLLALSLGSHPHAAQGSSTAVVAWIAGSRRRRRGRCGRLPRRRRARHGSRGALCRR